MAQEPINNPREELKYKRRNSFLSLVRLIGNIHHESGPLISELDYLLDDFFESGIELREREKHLGK